MSRRRSHPIWSRAKVSYLLVQSLPNGTHVYITTVDRLSNWWWIFNLKGSTVENGVFVKLHKIREWFKISNSPSKDQIGSIRPLKCLVGNFVLTIGKPWYEQRVRICMSFMYQIYYKEIASNTWYWLMLLGTTKSIIIVLQYIFPILFFLRKYDFLKWYINSTTFQSHV